MRNDVDREEMLVQLFDTLLGITPKSLYDCDRLENLVSRAEPTMAKLRSEYASEPLLHALIDHLADAAAEIRRRIAKGRLDLSQN